MSAITTGFRPTLLRRPAPEILIQRQINRDCARLTKTEQNGALTAWSVSGFICAPLGKFMYAVLETGSKQYRVSAGDTIEIERLAIEAGKPVTFDRVLLINADGKVTVGAPTVTGATVVADVVEHIRGEKKLTFKMKRRKGYHKSIGHRQELTVVKVKEIKA
jgi:large subunit ribosomal protein L21